MNSDLNIYSYSSVFRLTNFMNILQNFNYLRHDYYFLNNFFNYVWNFNEFFFSDCNSHRNLLESINNLKNFFDIVDVSDNFFEFFSINKLFNSLLNLYDLSCFFFNCNYFFLIPDNLSYGFN